MNAVGIDVSKGKSMVMIMRSFGEVVASPFEANHSDSELGDLAKSLKSLSGETKVILECTGAYFYPIAHALHEAGLFVSIIHAKLIHDYGNNTIRKVKTDKADSIKIANYGLSNWMSLQRFCPEDDVRRSLRAYSRQYAKYTKLKVSLKNNFISLTDQTFPGVNELFSSPPRKSDGREKWLDFAAYFWHCECVASMSENAFTKRYQAWCTRNGYRFSKEKACDVYTAACDHTLVIPQNDTTELLVKQSVKQINAVSESIAIIAAEMKRLAAFLPEYSVVSAFYGVGEILCPQIMAEVGNIYRFKHKGALVCFSGLEAPPYQSGKLESANRAISKKGSPHL